MIWKRIIGFSDYEISNDGQVMSFKYKKPKTLKPKNHTHGYVFYKLSNDNKELKTVYAHICVAKHFIENKNNLTQVNHKNTNKKDNLFSNLEWITPKGNTQHAQDNGLRDYIFGSRNNMAKLNEVQVKEIKRLSVDVGTKRLSEIFNVSRSTIKNIKNGSGWKHLWN